MIGGIYNWMEYAYNKNGAMTKDLNAGISKIQYNLLNLPEEIEIKYDNGYYSGPDDKNYFYIKDHLGNVRVVIDKDSDVAQYTDYDPFGMIMSSSTNQSVQAYKYNGKEFMEQSGLNIYDYGTRWYDPARIQFWTMDPLAEKYPWISPYAYCGNNPLRYIDPDGRDIWEINEMGEIIKRMKDKMQDAFYMVAKDAEGNYQRTFTTDAEGNKTYNSVAFEYGTVTGTKKAGWFRDATSFSVINEAAGADLFKFFADNTKIEFGLINTMSNGSTVMTNHKEGSVSASATAQKLSDKGQTVTSVVHNHPNNSQPSGFRVGATSGDKFAANLLINSHGYQVERYVYQPNSGNLVLYDKNSIIGAMSWGLIFPSSVKKSLVVPVRRYHGVGLPPL
jgi:RHS repeat-associated protein